MAKASLATRGCRFIQVVAEAEGELEFGPAQRYRLADAFLDRGQSLRHGLLVNSKVCRRDLGVLALGEIGQKR